jgi:excisionase family DNA binding protein
MVADQAYLTPDDVAERFQVPRARVLRWYREGRLSGTKLGKAVRFTEKDLEAFVQAQQKGGDPKS